MGKHRFIDKKRSTTYTITYGGFRPDDEEEGQAAPAESSAAPLSLPELIDDPDLATMLGLGTPAPADEYDDVTEAERKEMLMLGLPNDGYNYLRHLRDPHPRKAQGYQPSVKILNAPESEELERPVGAASTSARLSAQHGTPPAHAESGGEAPSTGPSVFIASKFRAPAEDARLVDARGICVAGTVENEDDVDAAAPTISAFSRSAQLPVPQATGLPPGRGAASGRAAAQPRVGAGAGALGLKGRVVTELEDLEAAMLRLERADGTARASLASASATTASGATSAPAVPAIQVQAEGEDGEEDGDLGAWLDGFVVMASKAPATTSPHGPGAGDARARSASGGGGSEGEEAEEDRTGFEPLQEPTRSTPQPGAGPRSIASTYWRPERVDRAPGLQGLDDHFEQLALQYEDECLGDLEDGEHVERARGPADISTYAAVLDEFMQESQPVLKPASARPPGHGMSDVARRIAAALGDSLPGSEDADEDEAPEGPASARPGPAAPRVAGDIAGMGAARKVATLEEADEEALAATRARLAAAAAALASSGVVGDADALPEALGVVALDRGERWDCESVLSLRSNLDNHPGRIVEPQGRAGHRGGPQIVLSAKTGAPKLPQHPITIQEGDLETGEAEGEEEGEEEVEGVGSGGEGVALERRKGETAEERRARKATVKAARREARAAKKELKALFRAEATKAHRASAGRAVAGGAAGAGSGVGSSVYVMN